MPDGLFANPLHWVILIVVVLIIFGPGKLPGVGGALGKSLKEFKRASQEHDSPVSNAQISAPSQSAAEVVAPTNACPSCGHANAEDMRFCGACGASLATPVATNVEATDLVEEKSAAEPAPVVGPSLCPLCQTENPPSSRFCAHCGKLMEQAAQRV